ncbi:Superfamily II DNA or RNA helicase, SNF2 family [Evansella caseinilytica]|uniref:Superfamily II DNA or RNA helicase, SNF2 family n=1 Tax=Evansella caseinilytica TaxID=1503961 RepID=A0A1H3GSS4_9BACI|nr:DEAD/DEAH box helicase [Evansella caseinilytica]SDY06147.1 Superfamily II DNA or RNA helicase, SNF2 family [Evansella caseinilytica]
MNINDITEVQIAELCPHAVLQRGRQYFNRGDVGALKWNEFDRMLTAKVYGSEPYDVEIEIQHSGDIRLFSCSCPAFEQFSGICNHLVAVLLEMKSRKMEEVIPTLGPGKLKPEDKDKRLRHSSGILLAAADNAPFQQEIRKAREMIQSFQQIYMKKQETYHEREELQLEYRLKLDPGLYAFQSPFFELELRVGPKRLYIVRDLREFLRAVHQEQTMKFAKLFTYDPADYVFTEEDRAVLDRLWKIHQLRADARKFPFYSRETADERKSMELPPPMVLELLQLLENRKVIVELHGYDYQGFRLMRDGSLPMQFVIGESELTSGHFYFRWENSEEIAFFGAHYRLLFYRGRFYPLDQDQTEAIQLLMNHFTDKYTSEVTIARNDLENFASMVLPQLQTIGEVDVSEEVQGKIHMAPLKGKLYVDYADDRLTAELIFQYGDDTYSPFDTSHQYNGRVTVRDVEKEFFLLSHIERIPFKYNGKELYLDSFDDILDFVMDELPKLSQWLEVFTTSPVKGLIYEPVESPAIRVETDERLNLLDVEFKMEGIADEEIDRVLEALLANKKYYRLSGGAFVNLGNEEFQGMKGVLEELELGSGTVSHRTKLPMLKAFQLSENDHFHMKKGKGFRRLVERILHPEEVEAEVPASLDSVLRDYQKIGYRWLASLAGYGFGGVLADDMGLGKTLQVISYLAARKQQQGEGITLIICPSSLVYNWQKEVERFAPELTTAVISGSAEERKEALDNAEGKDIWITSYPLIRRDAACYADREFTTLILDEAQYVKNDWTKTARAVKSIRARQAFALSGTPIENSLNELYSIFDLVLPGLFKNKAAFKAMDQDKVAKRIRPFVLRRLKKDVLTELPEKIESVQYTELTDQQKKLYLAQLRLIQSDAKEAINANAFQKNRIKILAGLTRLRQICCHPGLFMKEYDGSSGKMERLFEYLEEAVASGRRVVLFSQFTQMLALIRERLKNYSWSYHYLDGATPAKERLELADRFNSGEKELFLISLKAGGTGLNLTGGDTVILFDSWWNPAVEEQAADRVYRFGQKKVVQVTKLITTGTIEEKIHQLQEQKRELLDRVIQPGETMITSLTKEDIAELLEL